MKRKLMVGQVLAFFVLGIALIFRSNVTKVGAAGVLTQAQVQLIKILGQPNERETMTNEIGNRLGFHVGGVHVDNQGRIYAYDSGNNRILGWDSYAQDKLPTLVIGQPDFYSGLVNGDNTKYLNPTASTLALLPFPVANSPLEGPREGQMATDADGNLYILDTGNNRVLKFNQPFATDAVADEVWGQPDFVSRKGGCGINGKVVDESSLCTEYKTEFNGLSQQVYMTGVAVDAQGNLWVTDTGNHRVLRFSNVNGVIAKSADVVLGQPDFSNNSGRAGSATDLNKMIKPNSLAFDSNGDLYVLEGEWNGQSRIAVFTPPFSSGMSAVREIGRGNFGWPRGLAFEPGGSGIWINDVDYNRLVKLDRNGSVMEIIGQPDNNTFTCFGLPNQGFLGVDGSKYNNCEPGGGIGVDANGNMYFALNGNADPRSIVRFKMPVQRGTNNLAVANGRLLHEGWNQFSGRTFYDAYGMTLTNQSGAEQLIVSDRQRLLVWNNPLNVSTFANADYVVGQDAPDQNTNNNGGIFSGIDLGPQTVGAGFLWVSAYDRIFAFALPITGGGKNYQPVKVLNTGAYPTGNVFWSDENVKVAFRASGIAFDPTKNALWVSDSQYNRVFRINDPMGAAKVDMVIGQPDKNSTQPNAGMPGPNAKGFGVPWALQFDRFGNLYVVDSKWEGGGNNRVMRFSAASLQSASMFPFPDAAGVYAKQSLTSTSNWGTGTPQTPSNVSFDSQNRMIMSVDSYGNKQNEKVFVYDPGHETQTAPQPSQVIPLAFGQAAVSAFYPNDNTLWIQDHTWNRILQLSIAGSSQTVSPTMVPSVAPTMAPTATSVPLPTVIVFTPTRTPTPTPAANYLLNSSFESDINSDGLPDNWLKSSNSTTADGKSTTSKVLGSFAYKITPSSRNNEFKSVLQSFSLNGVSGDNFSVKVWHMIAKTTTGDIRVRVEFVKADGSVMGINQTLTKSIAGDYQTKSFSAPTDYRTVTVMLQSDLKLSDVYFDDVSVTKLPSTPGKKK